MLENEKEMFLFLKAYFEHQKYENAMKSLYYARDSHEGQTRDNGVPYIIHPLAVACYGILLGIDSDIQTSIDLLHDVPEDCQDDLSSFDIDSQIKQSANSLNFKRFKKMVPYVKSAALELYYSEIKQDKLATFTKLKDRLHNLSTIDRDFPIERKLRYTKETKEYIYPLLDYTRNQYPQQSTATFLLNYNIKGFVNAAEQNTPTPPSPTGNTRIRNIA